MNRSGERVWYKKNQEPPFFRHRRQERFSRAGMVGALALLAVLSGWTWQQINEIEPTFSLAEIIDSRGSRVPLDGFIPAQFDLSDASERRRLAQVGR